VQKKQIGKQGVVCLTKIQQKKIGRKEGESTMDRSCDKIMDVEMKRQQRKELPKGWMW